MRDLHNILPCFTRYVRIAFIWLETDTAEEVKG